MSSPNLAVVGATGVVGRELLQILAERDFSHGELRAYASSRSRGRSIDYRGQDLAVQELSPQAFAGIDLAFFCAGSDLSREYVPQAVAAGALVIDNSSAFRLRADVPLVVPECNGSSIADHAGILANPNCSTIIMVMALAPLHAAFGLRRVHVVTYQAASGAGQAALTELRSATAALLAGEPHVSSALPHSLALNLFPHIDAFADDGYTLEEDKMLYETRKILGLEHLTVEATCVRVPVERCHSMALSLELDRACQPDQAREILTAAPGIKVLDRPDAELYPQPAVWAGQDQVAVGRIRSSRSFPGGLCLWVVGDQLRKGAALNAVQIAESVPGRPVL